MKPTLLMLESKWSLDLTQIFTCCLSCKWTNPGTLDLLSQRDDMKCGRKRVSRPRREYRADEGFTLSTLTMSLIVLLRDQHDTTQLTNVTHCPFVQKGKLPLRWVSVRTVCVCVCVQVLSVCVRLSVTSVTSALQLHLHRHCECLCGILRVQGVTGCVTAGGVVLPLPCCL